MKKTANAIMRIFFALMIILVPFTLSCSAVDISVNDAENLSSQLDGTDFGLYKMPVVTYGGIEYQTYIAETFLSGLSSFAVEGAEFGSELDRLGLMDVDGKILLQPKYLSIYPLEKRTQTSPYAEEFPNLLIAVDEDYKYHIFNCRTKELLPDTYDFVGNDYGKGFYNSFVDGIEELTPEERWDKRAYYAYICGSFIPVYVDGQGHGMLNFDGELTIPCAYTEYKLVHDRRMAMDTVLVHGDPDYPDYEHDLDLYDETGKVLTSQCTYIDVYSEGMAYARKRNAASAEELHGYIDFYGGWKFTLDEKYTAGGSFSDGLVRSSYEDPDRNYDAIPVYFDQRGAVAISMADLYDTALNAMSDPYISEVTATDFHAGRAFVTFENFFNDTTIRYLVFANGETKKLGDSSEAYFNEFNGGGALVSTTGDTGVRDNILTKWGYYLLDGTNYSVGYKDDYPFVNGKCQWVRIQDNTTGLSAYLSLAEGRVTDFLYTEHETMYRTYWEYKDVQYLTVVRDGKVGVLGPDASEIVPCVYDAVLCPEGKRGYFLAYTEDGIDRNYTGYTLDGALIGEHELFQYLSSYSIKDGAVFAHDDYWLSGYVIDPDGNLFEVQEDCWALSSSEAFAGGLLWAMHSYSGEYDESLGYNPYVEDLGFLDEQGKFHLLVHEGNALYDRLADAGLDMTNGVSDFWYDENCRSRAFLSNKRYSFGDWAQVPGKNVSPIVEVLSTNPADDATGINTRLESAEVTFNQEVLLVNPEAIQVSCPLSSPGYYVDCTGDTLKICFTEPLEYGEPYTVTIGDTAVRSAQGQISTFNGYTFQFKLSGLSAEELMTYYPQHLQTPDSMAVKFAEADHAVELAMDEYAGFMGLGKNIASIFYAAKNYVSITADEIARVCGWSGTGDELQENVLETFIAQACIRSAEKHQDAKDISKEFAELVKNFDLYDDESYLIDITKKYVNAAGFNLGDDQISSIVKAVKKATGNDDFLDHFSTICDDFNDIAGEYIAVLISYTHMNTETANSMLRHLPRDSELYEGLRERVDAMSGNNLYTYLSLMHATLDETFDMIFVKSLKEVLEAGAGDMLKKTNMVINMAYKLYDAASSRAEVTEYIKALMFTGYVRSLDTALNDVILDMMVTQQATGATTAQQRADFEAIYKAKHASWLMLLDQTAKLFDDKDSNVYSKRCLDARDVIESDCGYGRYIYECKLQAPHTLAPDTLATEGAGTSATVSGFRDSSQRQESASAAVLSGGYTNNSGNSAAPFSLRDIRVNTPAELQAWLGYEPEEGSYASAFVTVTSDITLDSAAPLTVSSYVELTVPEGVTLTISGGTNLKCEGYVAVEGTLINHGAIDLDCYGGLYLSQPNGRLINNGAIRINRTDAYEYGALYSDALTTIANNGSITVSGECIIRSVYTGSEPTGTGVIKWPTRPIAVPDSDHAWGAVPYNAVTIPAVLAGKSVDAVAAGAFANDHSLRIATITGSSAGTTVGAEAFANCIALERVVLGNVVSVGEKAFANCAVHDVFIPASVASIGAEAFDGVSVVYGMTAVAENHAASIGAAYVDVSKAKTALEIQSPPVKTAYETGETLDLTGLVLTSNGEAVSLEDCYVEKLPAKGGTHALVIQYLDAFVTIDVTVAAPPHDHIWSTLWTTSDTHHWHECTAADCPVTVDSEKDGYGAHSFTVYVSDRNATCLEDGTKTASCGHGCGEKHTVTDPDSALGHFFIDYVPDGNATCTADGTKTAVCVSGDVTDTIPDPGSRKPHSFTHYVSDNNATCLLDGTKTAQCDNCDAKDTVNEEGTARNHSFTNYIPDGNATCLLDGTKTAQCDRCTAKDTVPDHGSALGHSFTNYVPDGNAACLTDGTKTAKCDRCTVTDTLPDEYSALNHRFTNYVSDGNAWCEKDGTRTAKCDYCDATDTVADAGSALEHTYTDDADPSCNRCEHIRDLAQPEHVHHWSEQWVYTDTHHWHECTAAGCTVTANSEKNGYRTHTYTGSFDTTCECGYVRGVIRIVGMPTAAAAGYAANMTLAEIVLNDGKVTDVNAAPLAGTWAWAVPDTKVYAGTNGYTAVFRPTNTQFPEVRVEVEVTVTPAAQTITAQYPDAQHLCRHYAGAPLELSDKVSSSLNVSPVFVITEDEGEAYVEGTVLHSPDAGFVTVEARFSGVDVNGDGAHEYAPGIAEIHVLFTTVPMFRMYDPNAGEHFYTGSELERDTLVTEGWNYEGVGFNYPAIGAPVYRLYNPVSGDHLYTMNQTEIQQLTAGDWNVEGVAFNSAPDTEVAQYRLWNPNAVRGAWHFTSDAGERAMLIGAGWVDQGIGWYSTRK